MDKIIESVLGGVGAGVVVAIILGVYEWGRRRCHRREQIHHIRTVIEKADDQIQKAVGLAPEGRMEEVRAHQERFGHYRGLIRDLTIALEDRSGELSSEQRYELRKFVVDHEAFRDSFLYGNTPSTPFYEQKVFNKLYALKWLGSRRRPANLNR